jgi:hypothetical protein
MLINYRILKDRNLLVHQFIGDFSIKDYVSYVYEVKKHPDAKDVKKILTDVREASPNNVLDKLDWLIKFRNKVVKKSYENVFIVDDPDSTVATHLYQNGKTNRKFPYQYCSTLEQALKILELKDSKDEIVSILNSFIVLP